MEVVALVVLVVVLLDVVVAEVDYYLFCRNLVDSDYGGYVEKMNMQVHYSY